MASALRLEVVREHFDAGLATIDEFWLWTGLWGECGPPDSVASLHERVPLTKKGPGLTPDLGPGSR